MEELGKYLEVKRLELRGSRSSEQLATQDRHSEHRVGSGYRCRDAPYGLRVRVPPIGMGSWREVCPDSSFALFIWLQMQLGFSSYFVPNSVKLAEFESPLKSRDMLIGQVCGGRDLIGSDSDDDKNGGQTRLVT